MTTLRFLRRFLKQSRGSAVIEGLFGSVLLLGWFMAAYQIYDAFRMRAVVSRATYTVADLISRERDPIGPAYVAGIKKIFDAATRSSGDGQSWIRVTLVSCVETETDARACDGTNKLVTLRASDSTAGSIASFATGGHAAYTQSTLDAKANVIPMMAAGDSAAIVEAGYLYWPIFNIGDKALSLGGNNTVEMGLRSNLQFGEFVVTRPRGPRTKWFDSK